MQAKITINDGEESIIHIDLGIISTLCTVDNTVGYYKLFTIRTKWETLGDCFTEELVNALEQLYNTKNGKLEL